MNQKVDAWFLDSLRPLKTRTCGARTCSAPWRLARARRATLATFTSAGFVRRGLQEAGFTMRKTKGFGRKRDMLIGVMEQDLAIPAQALVCRAAPAPRVSRYCGRGIASALLSLALLHRGWQVTLCADGRRRRAHQATVRARFIPY